MSCMVKDSGDTVPLIMIFGARYRAQSSDDLDSKRIRSGRFYTLTLVAIPILPALSNRFQAKPQLVPTAR